MLCWLQVWGGRMWRFGHLVLGWENRDFRSCRHWSSLSSSCVSRWNVAVNLVLSFDRIAISSTHASVWTPSCCIDRRIGSSTMLRRVGDNGHPCLTPRVMLNVGKPMACKVLRINSCSIESKHFWMSKGRHISLEPCLSSCSWQLFCS